MQTNVLLFKEFAFVTNTPQMALYPMGGSSKRYTYDTLLLREEIVNHNAALQQLEKIDLHLQ